MRMKSPKLKSTFGRLLILKLGFFVFAAGVAIADSKAMAGSAAIADSAAAPRNSDVPVSCEQPHQLPLMTHYRRGVGFELGSTDDLTSELYNPNVETEYKQGRPYVRVYAQNFIPTVNNYIAMKYDLQSYKDEVVIERFRGWCQQTGVAFRLLQPGIEVSTREQIEEVLEAGQTHGQVIHSLVFRNNLFTLIVPPKWGGYPPQKKYPLLINGFYDLNGNLLGSEGPRFIKVISELYKQNQFGAVGILWNGGGATASRTVNNKAYKDLNDFLKMAIPALRIKKDQVVALGGSRGGVTALNMAAHSAMTAIKVRFVYAANPPNAFDQILSIFGSTFPSLLAASDWSTGWVGSFLPSFIYPEGYPGYSGLSGNLSHLKVLTGFTDWKVIKERFNLMSPDKIRNLKQRKTEVFLELGTHDNICPYYDKSLLFQKFNRARIPTETRVVFLKGHRPDAGWRDQRVLEVMQKISNELLFGQPKKPLVRAGIIESYLIAENNTKAVQKPEWAKQRPLVLDVPRYFSEELTGPIVGVGMPGRQYRLYFEGPEGFQKTIDLNLNKWGQGVYPVNPVDFPLGTTTLASIVELNDRGQVMRVLKTLKSSLPMNDPLVMTRLAGSLRPLGPNIPELILNGFLGPNKEFQLSDGEGPIGGTHGVVEIPD